MDVGYLDSGLTISYTADLGAVGGAETVATGADTFSIAQHAVTAKATDGSTNFEECTFNVTVVDTSKPNSITCGDRKSTPLDSGPTVLS